jgi:hypothetical protein
MVPMGMIWGRIKPTLLPLAFPLADASFGASGTSLLYTTICDIILSLALIQYEHEAFIFRASFAYSYSDESVPFSMYAR